MLARIDRSFFACLLAVSSSLPAPMAAAGEKPGEDYYTFYENAEARASQRDYDGAIIELKNALGLNPSHLPSRILLGRAYLRVGQGAAAEKELREALRLGADQHEVLPVLGNALLLQRKHEEILQTVQTGDPSAEGGWEVLTIRGRAHLELGQLTEAALSFAGAALLRPDLPDPLLGRAEVFIGQGEVKAGEDLIDRAMALAPENPEVWYQKGRARDLAGDRAGALEAYDAAIERNPNHLRGRTARAILHLERGDYELARGDAEFVHSIAPTEIKTSLILGQALSRLGEFERAQEVYRGAALNLSEIPPHILMDDPPRLHLAALVHFMQGQFEKTQRYLERYLALRPQSIQARSLLARVKMRLGDFDGALDILSPLYTANRDDSMVASLMGDAYLRAGRYLEAADAFERAAALTPGSAGVKTALALSRLGAGRTEDAIQDLREVLDLDTGSKRAGIVLTLVHLRRGEHVEALATAKRLLDQFPDSPAVHNLLGTVHLSAGDLASARRSFEGALKKAPDFEPARYNLIRLDLAAGNTEAAAERYQSILDRDPRSVRALLGLSEIRVSEGRQDEALSLLEKAVDLAPEDVEANLRAVDLYLGLRDHDSASRTIDRLQSRYPDHAHVLEGLARVQVAMDKRSDAVQTLRRAARAAEYDGDQLMRMAVLQVRLEDYEEARWTLQKAGSTDLAEPAEIALVRLDVLTRNFDAAMEQASALRRRSPDSATADLLTGEALLASGRTAEAERAYEAGLEKEKTTELVLGLYEARKASGSPDEALNLLERWIDEHPGDLRARRALAFGYFSGRRIEQALELHEKLLGEQPEDPALLTNLARLYQETGDPRARSYAERAVERAPVWPESLDTLGWILVTEGEPALALRLLREAKSRASRNWQIRYHLAIALNEVGRVEEARRELEEILHKAKDLPWIEQVQVLHERLSNG